MTTPETPELETRTAEEWAKECGDVNVPTPIRKDPRLPPPVPPPPNAHRAWRFLAAKALHGWPIGKVMTRAEYETGVQAAMDLQYGGRNIPVDKLESFEAALAKDAEDQAAEAVEEI